MQTARKLATQKALSEFRGLRSRRAEKITKIRSPRDYAEFPIEFSHGLHGFCRGMAEMFDAVLKAVLGGVGGAVGSIVGACIAFIGVWLTQRWTAEREKRKSDQEKEIALRAQALQFITDVVSAARLMSSLTYYASATVDGSALSARVKEYEKEIALLLTKVQAGQIALSFMTDKLEEASRRSWQAVRNQADRIDEAITTRSGDDQLRAIASILVDVPEIIDPLRKDFSQLLRPGSVPSAPAQKS